jgi:hypothetical protein
VNLGRSAEQSEEFLDADVHDFVLRSVLTQLYDVFRLQYGRMETLLQQSAEILRSRLDSFFSTHQPLVRIEQCDLFSSFNGLSFVPLEKLEFLRIQCAMSHLLEDVPEISAALMLFDESVVVNSFDMADLRPLLRHLAVSLPTPTRSGPHTSAASSLASHVGAQPVVMRVSYLYGPQDLRDQQTVFNSPPVFLTGGGDGLQEFVLTVLRADLLTFVFALKPAAAGNVFLHRKLHDILAENVSSFMHTLSGSPARNLSESNVRFLYLSHLNSAVKSNINRALAGSQDVMMLVNDLHADFIAYVRVA